MNKVFLMGRLTRDPDIRTTQSNIQVATFTLAVDRKYKDSNGDRPTDFIRIVAWRGTADFVGKWCTKGTKLVVCGNIQTRNYENKEGQKVYVTEVVADEVEFAESKKAESKQEEEYIKTDDATELPFDL
jgi:single-strand DNA-binding protein